MKRKRFSEEQIAFALRQAESGAPVREVVRKLGISEWSAPRFWTSLWVRIRASSGLLVVPG